MTGSDPSPPDSAEAAVRAAWAAVLGASADSLDTDQTFLSAGGHSLAAGRLIARLRGELAVDVSMSAILREDPTLDELVALVDERSRTGAGSKTARPARADGGPGARPGQPAPLAPTLRRIWTWHRLYPESPAYNVVRVLQLEGQLRPAPLRAALADLTVRHEALRCAVSEPAAGHPQVRLDDLVVPTLVVEVLPDAPPATTAVGADPNDWMAAVEPSLRRIADQPFAMDHPPLWRVGLVYIPAIRRSFLILVMHHLICDLRSTDQMLADLAYAYTARSAGSDPVFAEPAPSLLAHLGYEHELIDSAAWQADLAWWADRLAGSGAAPALPLAAAHREDAAFAATTHSVQLSHIGSAALDGALRRHGLTPALLFVTAAASVLTSWSGQGRTEVVGLPSQRISRPEDVRLIGFLLDTLPLPFVLDRQGTFTAAYRQLRDAYSEAVDHALPPFDAIADQLRLPHTGRSPLIRLWFSDLTQAVCPPRFGDLVADEYDLPPGWALFDLGFYLGHGPEGYRLHLVSPEGLCAPADTEALLRQVVDLAVRAAANPQRSVAALLGSEAEGADSDPGSTGSGSVSSKLLEPEPTTDAIRRHAAHGRRTAVQDSDGELDYRDLDAAIDAAASELVAGSMVEVAARRDRDFLVRLLACWRASATAVLVDQGWPDQRRERARQQITGWETGPDQDRAAGHVLFTSGTTGDPLAVQVSSRVSDAALAELADLVGVDADDRVAMLSVAAHDPVLRDLGLALRCGGTVCIPPPEAFSEPSRLAAWLRTEQVTVISATPLLLSLLVAADPEPQPELRIVISGGSPLSRATASSVRAWAPQALLVNGYGCTETPQLVAAELIAPYEELPPTADLPIGWPLSDRRLELRTPEGQVCEVGQLGEIWVAEPHLGDRYLTAPTPSGLGSYGGPLGRFVVDDHGRRWLRTGDLARRDAAGRLHFAGRGDRQVLVNGHRLMLEELEAVARSGAGVGDAVAEVIGDGGGQAVRVWVQQAAGAVVSAAAVRSLLATVLPVSAVPSRVIVVDRLSVGANLKPSAPTVEPAPTYPPDQDSDGTADDAFARVAEAVLGAPLDPTRNFFDAGFTSLSLLQLGAELSVLLHRPVEPLALFQHPNLRSLRAYLTQLPSDEFDRTQRAPRPRAKLTPVLDQLSSRRNDARRWIHALRDTDR